MNGFIGIKPCGCWAGWISGLEDQESKDWVFQWLKAGYYVREVANGESVRMVRCDEHRK